MPNELGAETASPSKMKISETTAAAKEDVKEEEKPKDEETTKAKEEDTTAAADEGTTVAAIEVDKDVEKEK